MDSPSPDPPIDSHRLNGWKEIASFLGKGVRTAQRWERELGLPVHRLGRQGGEIVFAFKTEIAAWRLAEDAARRGETPAAPGNGAAAGAGATAASLSVSGGARRRWRLAGAALGLGAVATAVYLLLDSGWLGPPQQPASWRVSGPTLTALNEEGAPIWSHTFPAPLVAQYYAPSVRPSAAAIADLDGDGQQELAIGLVPEDMRGPAQGFYVFNRDGSLRFEFRPSAVVHFGSTEYRGPWLFHRMFLVRREGERPSLWVAFVHGMEFPSLLVRLDPQGRVVSQYWSNGFIDSLLEAPWRQGLAVFVGAANNETHGASLAVFERDDVSGSAPAIDPDYRCTDCPDGAGLVEFLVFPRRCVARAQQGNATITEIWNDAGGRLHVSVTEWSTSPSHLAGSVFYWLGPELKPERAEVSAESLVVHQQMERAGYLDHPFGPADETALFPVRRWNGSAFVDLPPAPVTR